MRVNTKVSYTQQKFNLLREESEGYAKLLTELAQSTLQYLLHSSFACSPLSYLYLLSLVYCWSSDCDLLLEVFGAKPRTGSAITADTIDKVIQNIQSLIGALRIHSSHQ